jgi:Na+/H+ antiporter NhaC
MDGLPEGFKNMCGAIIILIFAWTLSSMTSLLGANIFIHDMVANQAAAIKMFLPFILFVVSVLLAFATGSSWGTFTVLIPIVCNVFVGNQEILAIAIAAVLSGSICGDHCSPISGTTIMSSAGSGCLHVNHVSTQLPYAFLVAAVSAVGFLIAGIIGYLSNSKMSMICMPVEIAVIILIVFVIKKKQQNESK